MPPIRSTPFRERSLAAEPDGDDHGFNPAWAVKPEPPATPLRPARVFEESPLPAPPVTVTQVTAPVAKDATESSSFMMLLYAMAGLHFVVTGTKSLITSGMEVGQNAVASVAGVVKSRMYPNRHNPIGRSGRRGGAKTPVKSTPKDSMLALPPHMVGATPNIVRHARGQRLRGDPATHTPTAEEARSWKLFHETPLHKKPKPAPETPLPTGTNSAPGTPWQTPKFEFNTPQRRMKMGKSKEFAMKIHQEEFKDWLKLLKKNDVRTTTLRRDLEKLNLPTELILRLYEKKENGQGADFDNLVKCFSHAGFTTHYKILVPVLKHPAPIKFQKGELRHQIDLESAIQQADGCCKFCRGFAWAGQLDVREVDKDEDVPCHSYHKSVKPYTAKENAEFGQNKYDSLFRRWCQETRYDWIFETPQLKNPNWQIPQDDPRLRHIAMVRQQHRANYGGPKMYDADLMANFAHLRKTLTKQDRAAKIFIDAVKKGNTTLGTLYEKMDAERKRRQVQTQLLCVRQVKIVPKENRKRREAVEVFDRPIEPVQNNKRSADFGALQSVPEKSAKRVKFAEAPEGAAPTSDDPTNNAQRSPSKGILKASRTAPNVQAAAASRSPMKTTFKKPRISQPTPKAMHAANPAVGNPIVQPSFKPQISSAPKLDFASVPSLAPTHLFDAGTGKSYDPHLPPSFDPIVLRGQAVRMKYEQGVSQSTKFWESNSNSWGWKPDRNLSKEENDAERVNYNIMRMQEEHENEMRLRELEKKEEAQTKTRNPGLYKF